LKIDKSSSQNFSEMKIASLEELPAKFRLLEENQSGNIE